MTKEKEEGSKILYIQLNWGIYNIKNQGIALKKSSLPGNVKL